MGKTPVIKSQKLSKTANFESTNTLVFLPQKKTVKSRVKSNFIFSISHFWHLIVITSVIFCFGGFGFGVALRWGQNWQSNDFIIPNNSQSSQNYQ